MPAGGSDAYPQGKGDCKAACATASITDAGALDTSRAVQQGQDLVHSLRMTIPYVPLHLRQCSQTRLQPDEVFA